jgi:hypothetical protein
LGSECLFSFTGPDSPEKKNIHCSAHLGIHASRSNAASIVDSIDDSLLVALFTAAAKSRVRPLFIEHLLRIPLKMTGYSVGT